MDLFEPIIRAERQHPQFCALRDFPLHVRARALMNVLATRMGDPNGNFVNDFHSRAFELACFAYLEEAGLTADRAHERLTLFACEMGRSLPSKPSRRILRARRALISRSKKWT